MRGPSRKERKELRRRREAFLADQAARSADNRGQVLMDDSWLSRVEGGDDVASGISSG